jgi:hypothetical protein
MTCTVGRDLAPCEPMLIEVSTLAHISTIR